MKRSFQEHHWIWIGAGAVVIIATVVALVAFNYPSDDEQAEEKAQELSERFAEAGIFVPDQDVFVGMFGNDGGAVCEAGDSDLGFAELNQRLANGAAQVGIRPVLVAEEALQGQAIIIDVYCPEHTEDFLDYVDDLEFKDVIND